VSTKNIEVFLHFATCRLKYFVRGLCSEPQHVMGMSSGVIAAHAVQAGTQLFLAPRLSAQFGNVTPMSATAVPSTFLGAGGTQYLQATDASSATGATNILYPFSPYLQSMLDYSTAGLERSAAGK